MRSVPATALRHRQRLAVGVVQRGEQRPHLAIDRLAGIGQPQVPRGALDQPQPEIGLQSLHCSTEARLGCPSTRAAAVKPPCSTTSQNSSQSRHSMADCPSSGTVCPAKSDYRIARNHLTSRATNIASGG